MSRFLTVLRQPWPARWRLLVVLALYAAYLPLSGYTPAQFRFDAAEYWELSLKFTPHGRFSLLAFDDPLRGYLGPLLILPGRFLCHFTGWPILRGAQLLGAGWAALLFGVAMPALWARVAGGRPTGGRWLLLLGLSFVFWRDYFNFTLTDMPALALLLLSVVALGREGLGWAFLAGLLVAAAVNMRPVYLASVPVFVALVWLPRFSPGKPCLRAVGLMAGAALVLLPQLRINQQHFGTSTPLVLARMPGLHTSSLYLEKLNWGLAQQKYETNLGTDYPSAVMLFKDEAGAQLLKEAGVAYFSTYSAYLGALLRHPLTAIGMLSRHLFNGLDIQYPTPYIKVVYTPTWGLAWLNYTMWFGVALVLARTPWRRWPAARWLLLAVLLLPCLAVLPLGMECRYLLPLHLLLCATLALGWPAAWTWGALRALPLRSRWLLATGYAGFVGVCFLASAVAQATLEFGPRSLF